MFTQVPGSQDLQQFCILIAIITIVHTHRIIICLNVHKDFGYAYIASSLLPFPALPTECHGKAPGDSPIIERSDIWSLVVIPLNFHIYVSIFSVSLGHA